MTDYITVRSVADSNRKEFLFQDRVNLGYAYIEVDGFYVFVFCSSDGGCWSSYVLREIADKLDELNKPYKRFLDSLDKE